MAPRAEAGGTSRPSTTQSPPIALRGYRGPAPDGSTLRARLERLKGSGLEAQILRADRIAGQDHLRAAILHADRAFHEQRNVATTWPAEVLRYAAGARQIHRAITFLGVSDDVTEFAVVLRGTEAAFDAVAAEWRWDRDDSVFAAPDRAVQNWNLSTSEMAVVPREKLADLILERVALADVEK
ncbi:MAG: KEOPS complex subunit Cgi121 [Thermoplasmatota archaeon]